MTGRQVIWIAIVFIIIGMTWGDPQPASSSTRQLPLQSVGLNDVDDDNDDNDMPLGAAGYIKMASIQSCMNTIEHLTAAALVDLSHGSRPPPRAPAELIYRVVLLSLPTVFHRSEVFSASSFLGASSLDLLRRTRLSLPPDSIDGLTGNESHTYTRVKYTVSRGAPDRTCAHCQVEPWRTRAASEGPSGDEGPEFVPLHADQFGRRRSR
jgi:hypothetical protein